MKVGCALNTGSSISVGFYVYRRTFMHIPRIPGSTTPGSSGLWIPLFLYQGCQCWGGGSGGKAVLGLRRWHFPRTVAPAPASIAPCLFIPSPPLSPSSPSHPPVFLSTVIYCAPLPSCLLSFLVSTSLFCAVMPQSPGIITATAAIARERAGRRNQGPHSRHPRPMLPDDAPDVSVE